MVVAVGGVLVEVDPVQDVDVDVEEMEELLLLILVLLEEFWFHDADDDDKVLFVPDCACGRGRFS